MKKQTRTKPKQTAKRAPKKSTPKPTAKAKPTNPRSDLILKELTEMAKERGMLAEITRRFSRKAGREHPRQQVSAWINGTNEPRMTAAMILYEIKVELAAERSKG